MCSLSDILRRYSKSEPTSLTVLRVFVMFLLFACISGYIVVLVFDISDDSTIVRNSQFLDDFLPIPAIVMKYKQTFNITCAFSYNDGLADSQQNSSCNQYLSQPVLSEDGTYTGQFYASDDINIVSQRRDIGGIHGVSFNFSVNDPSLISNTSTSLITIYISDQGANVDAQLINADALSDKNLHFMGNRQMYLLPFARNIRRPIRSRLWRILNIFGIPPRHETSIPSLTSSLVNGGSVQGGNTTLGGLFVFPSTFLVNIEEERRVFTVLNSLGLLGGIFSLIMGLYVILFGSMVRPWGLVQLHCCFFATRSRKKLRNSLPVIPLYDKSQSTFPGGSDTESLNDTVARLQQRYDALEFYLRSYVVDVSHLRRVEANNAISPSGVSRTSSIRRENDEDLDASSEHSSTSQHNVMRNSQVTQAAFVPIST